MAIDVVAEEIADNLEEIAEVTRRINTRSVGFFLGGAAVGLAVGFYWGHRFNKEKLRAEAFAESEKEVAKIRETYQTRAVVTVPKPSVEELIEEKGYDRPLPAPVPGIVEPDNEGGTKVLDWDMERELAHRVANPDDPYVISQAEFHAHETGYRQVVFTYFARDDVMYDEEEEHPVPHADIVVGQQNLQFGYGTDDLDVVFVRNNDRQLEIEIVRMNESYEEKILGVDGGDFITDPVLSDDSSDDSDDDD